MKVVLALTLALVAVLFPQGEAAALKSTRQSRDLGDVLGALFDFLNADGLLAKVYELLDGADSDMCEIFLWATTEDDFLALLSDLRAEADYQEILSYLTGNGVDVGAITQELENLINYESNCAQKTGRLNLPNLGDKFEGILPETAEIIAYISDLIANSQEFNDLLDEMTGESSTQYILKFIIAHPTGVMIIDEFVAQGYERPEVLLQLLSDLLGLEWNFNASAARDINGALVAFFEFVNAQGAYDKLLELLTDPVNADACEIFIWATTQDDFLQLVEDLRATSAYQAIIDFLLDEGVDIDKITQALNDLINYESGCSGKDSRLNLPALGDEFEGIVPSLGEIYTYLSDLYNSGDPDIIALKEAISGDSNLFKTLIYITEHPTGQMIFGEFENQNYPPILDLLKGISAALDLDWPFEE